MPPTVGKAIGVEGHSDGRWKDNRRGGTRYREKEELLKRVLGWTLIAVGVPIVILYLGVPYSPSFSPEEMDRIWMQHLAMSLIGLSMVLCGGVIVFRCRTGKGGCEGH